MWYHLSMNKTDLPNPVALLRFPSFEYLDTKKDQPLLCVAPTVWQCLLAIRPIRVPLHIFRVDVQNPVPASSDNQNVADDYLTCEHRITTEVFDLNGGSISTEYIGRLELRKDDDLNILFAARHKKIRPNADQESRVFWQVDDDVWSIRNNGSDFEKDWNKFGST